MNSVELTLFKRYDGTHMIIYFLKFGKITLPNISNPVREVYLDIGIEYCRTKHITLRYLLNNLDSIVYRFSLPKFRGYNQVIRKFKVYKDPFQVIYLKGKALDNVLENYLQVIDDCLEYTSVKGYSSIRDIIVRNRTNDTRTIYY